MCFTKPIHLVSEVGGKTYVFLSRFVSLSEHAPLGTRSVIGWFIPSFGNKCLAVAVFGAASQRPIFNSHVAIPERIVGGGETTNYKRHVWDLEDSRQGTVYPQQSRQWFFGGSVTIVAVNFCGGQMERLKGRNGIRAKVGMFAGKVCCTSRRNKCGSHIHTLLLRAKDTLPFLYDETTIVLRARLTREVRRTHEHDRKY